MKILKSKWFLVITIIILVFGIPIIINELYKLNKGYITLWGANDTLSFYGTVLSFIGTVLLGGLALIQNIKANEISEKLLRKELLESTPYVAIKPNIIIDVKKEDSCTTSYVNIHSRECTQAMFVENTTIDDITDRYFYEYKIRFSFQLCSNCQINRANIITDSITLFETETPVLSTVTSVTNKSKVEMYTAWRDNENFTSLIKIYAFNNSTLNYIFESGKEISIIFDVEYESTMGITQIMQHQIWFRKVNGQYELIECNNQQIIKDE